ncbi:MAG: tol-pal system YbgF family protein [Granulosicoccus sp.]
MVKLQHRYLPITRRIFHTESEIMKIPVALFLLISLAACGNLVKNGGIVEAQNALENSRYQEALEYTEIAESSGNLTPENKAKLHYLRAQAQEGLGRYTDALNNYRYVANQHSDSAYAQPSRRKIRELSATSEQ